MENTTDSEARTGGPVEGEFENSPFGKWLAARAADAIRAAAGC
ncbi:hypothetical protein [Streptomyces sp. NPDC056165]